jgi:hypothetical protein
MEFFLQLPSSGLLILRDGSQFLQRYIVGGSWRRIHDWVENNSGVISNRHLTFLKDISPEDRHCSLCRNV